MLTSEEVIELFPLIQQAGCRVEIGRDEEGYVLSCFDPLTKQPFGVYSPDDWDHWALTSREEREKASRRAAWRGLFTPLLSAGALIVIAFLIGRALAPSPPPADPFSPDQFPCRDGALVYGPFLHLDEIYELPEPLSSEIDLVVRKMPDGITQNYVDRTVCASLSELGLEWYRSLDMTCFLLEGTFIQRPANCELVERPQ